MNGAGANVIRQRAGWGSQLWRSVTLRQTSYLYLSQSIALVLGFWISLINTRTLGPADFGLFAATLAATEFVTLFMDFGFFSSGARVLALKKTAPEDQRRIIGALILIALGLSFLAAVLLCGLSFFAVRILNADIEQLLRFFCPLLGLLTLQTLVESTCRGTNRIEVLSIFQLTSRGCGLVLMGALIAAGSYNLPLALTAFLMGSLLAAGLTLSRFRPRFTGLMNSFHELRQDVRSYGFKVYTGDIACTASFRTDSLLISHYLSTTAVGYYRLANLLINPMLSFSRSLSTALFSRFAASSRISSRVLGLNAAWLSLCSLGVIGVGEPLVRLLFGAKYQPVIELLPIMALVGLLGGLAQPLNMFLGARGKGAYLRTMALVLTACNLLFNLILIPVWGTRGACYACALALFINLLLHLHCYRKTVRMAP